MQAARYHGPRDGVVVEDVERPEVGPGEVLVRVVGAGVCHSDLHVLEGDLPLPGLPLTLGHENAGYVAAVGDGVDRVAEGDAVAVYGGWGCGDCRVCRRGDEQLCDLLSWVGIGVDGGYAEYLRVPDPRYLLDLGDLDPVTAAPLTDAALTAYRAVRKATADLAPTDVLAVIGVGGLGQYAVQFADTLTACDVVAVDRESAKRERAADLGATATVGSASRLPGTTRDLSDGAGAGAVVDFVGVDDTLQAGLNALREQGHLLLTGIGRGSVPFSWNPLNPPEVTLSTVRWGNRQELATVIDMADSLDHRIETVGFDDLSDTFDRLRAGDITGRAVLTPTG